MEIEEMNQEEARESPKRSEGLCVTMDKDLRTPSASTPIEER